MIGSLFHVGVWVRHFLYDKKILKKHFAELPAVSIGNVVAGGAGKTQVALLLANALNKDTRVAILSRGYLGRAEHAKVPTVVDVNKMAADLTGDEPWLLASRLPAAYVIVHKNRLKSAALAKKMGAQLLVLDDAMQHRKLHRDFEIVVIDGEKHLDSFLPKGNLRESLSRLQVADLIFFVGEPTAAVAKAVFSHTEASYVVAKILPQGFFQLDGTSIDSLKEAKVALFCGIGNPERFIKTLESLQVRIVATHFLRDHRSFTEKGLDAFASFAKKKGADFLLCSEKDRVKLPKCHLSLPIVWLKVSLEVVKNNEIWIRTVDEIKTLAKCRSS